MCGNNDRANQVKTVKLATMALRQNHTQHKIERGSIMETWIEYEKAKQFKVVNKIKRSVLNYCDDVTDHFENHRKERMTELLKLGKLEVHSSFLIDTNSIRGTQIHTIYKNGIVIVGSVDDRKIITMYLLSESQIARYGIVDEELVQTAILNKARLSNYQCFSFANDV